MPRDHLQSVTKAVIVTQVPNKIERGPLEMIYFDDQRERTPTLTPTLTLIPTPAVALTRDVTVVSLNFSSIRITRSV